MNYRMLGYLLSRLLLIEAALLLLPTLTALIYSESPLPFLLTVVILLAVSLPFAIVKPKNTRIYAKDGFVCVAAIWVLMSAFGALPFVFSGAIPNYIYAFFETASGFTTTGATILPAVEHLPRGILFWRSLTHWIGGMGVLVFMLAILPSAGGNAIHLMRAEVPGPTKGKIVPKLRQTALILYGIYMALTLIMMICLFCTGMTIYDSIVNSLATAGTGGFAVMNSSIAGYNNVAAEWVVAIFMFIFGVNFNLYFFILIGKAREFLKSEEFRVYVGLTLASATAIAINTWHLVEKAGGTVADCIRDSFFQTAAIMSTTGFSTADFNLWPAFSQSIIIVLMMIGACAGSTAGGLKLSRVMIIFKGMFKELKRMLRPNSVNVVKMDGEAVPDDTTRSAGTYLGIYFALIFFTMLLISFDGHSFTTNFTAALTCVNNVGPGLDLVGPSGNFSVFSPFSTIVLSLSMIFGRLEIMPMLILFSPTAWKKR